jgi:S-(hydroxymethyl)glutathione dehydrogenase / alcohol dehydrogenase
MTPNVTCTEAAILYRVGAPLELREIELPELQTGQVLVQVLYSGVCRSQLMEVRGKRGEDRWLPHLLGHEGCGVVLATGPGVSKVIPGDKVILGWLKGLGLDAPGAHYRCHQNPQEEINSGPITTFSRHTVVAENRLVKKPPLLPDDVAVLFGCAMLTGAGIVLNELHPHSGSSGAVIGLGGIGLSALAMLASRSCQVLVAIDISDEKLALARQLGATHTLNPARDDIRQGVQSLVPGGLDFCIESAGSTQTIEMGFACIRKHGGRLIFASHPPESEMIQLAPHDLISGKQIGGSWGGSAQPDRDIPLIAKICTSSGIPLQALLSKPYSLAGINDALRDLEEGTVLRPLIDMTLPNISAG